MIKLELAIKPVVQLLLILEVHPVPHSSACSFFCFSYLFYLGHLSLLEVWTKNRKQSNSSFCSFKSCNLETFLWALQRSLLCMLLASAHNEWCVLILGFPGWIPVIQAPLNTCSSCVMLQSETGTKFSIEEFQSCMVSKIRKLSVWLHDI